MPFDPKAANPFAELDALNQVYRDYALAYREAGASSEFVGVTAIDRERKRLQGEMDFYRKRYAEAFAALERRVDEYRPKPAPGPSSILMPSAKKLDGALSKAQDALGSTVLVVDGGKTFGDEIYTLADRTFDLLEKLRRALQRKTRT